MRVVVYDDDGEACYQCYTGPDSNHHNPPLDERRRVADALLFAYNAAVMRVPAFKVIGE